ncbi:MAG: aminotransferase class V-fold PLP-dependent enzyme [Planctomycetaceae bacterium]
MPELLYLDTARLGLMSPRACRASVDFARFAGEYGATLYLTDFLKDGFASLPSTIRDRYRGLEDWCGVASLRQSLRDLSNAQRDSNVLVASRAASLMKLAARLLVRPCHNILVTDLSWPAYDRILRRAANNRGYKVTKVRVRRRILKRHLTADELTDNIATQFVRDGCDGLFLPLVDNLGVQLPVRRIVERLRNEAELRFVVLDAAQAYNHVPLDLASNYCDFVIAGCHKWLRAFTPMGVGFFGHPATADYIRDSTQRWMRQGAIDEPLMRFVDELDGGACQRFGETVSLSPLLTSNAAVIDALRNRESIEVTTDNERVLTSMADSLGWRVLTPSNDLRSRIVLLQSPHESDRLASSETIRRRFLNRSIALSAYTCGIVRVSLPSRPFSVDDCAALQSALASTA